MKLNFKVKHFENMIMVIVMTCILTLFMIPQPSMAGGTQRIGGTNEELFKSNLTPGFQQTYTRVRYIVYGVAGLAAIAAGVAAMFGKFAWSKFLGIIIGIAMITLVDLLISYLGGVSSSQGILEAPDQAGDAAQ